MAALDVGLATATPMIEAARGPVAARLTRRLVQREDTAPPAKPAPARCAAIDGRRPL